MLPIVLFAKSIPGLVQYPFLHVIYRSRMIQESYYVGEYIYQGTRS